MTGTQVEKWRVRDGSIFHLQSFCRMIFMPIARPSPMRRISQQEFGEIAFAVVAHTPLEAIHWANITIDHVTFTTIR
jgi:hypothetical protein